jgi:hypothetical protein
MVDTLKVDMLVDTLKVVDMPVDTLKADMLVDTLKADIMVADITVADTVKVAGDLVLVNMAVSKITGTQVNRLLDMINHFKAKVSHTRWDLGADTVVVMVEDTAVELDSAQ